MKKVKQLKTYQLTVNNIDYLVNRTGRTKTYDLSIHEGRVHMNVPKKMSKQLIDQAIDDNQDWVKENIHFSPRHSKQARRLGSGSMIAYLGKKYPLQLISGNQAVLFSENRFLTGIPAQVKPENRQSYIRKKLSSWFKEQALLKFQQRTFFMANQMKLSPGTVTVRSYKARWGSCSSEGDLSYDWKLLQAPEAIIDYIVIHELSHLEHFDHSAAFWRLVSRYYPEHRQARAWLKNNQLDLVEI
ncbi:M48 family metallopeptidase [Piscirickettsia litoralis]|uniref:M48 family metallopeptidase n=1 Tax=Piscirickettsia litoralis TaxID=1891921 RepID=UPI001112F139|nr:SprT family zinc-dependent metalloprotease [Piscirickettsia litoralis]